MTDREIKHLEQIFKSELGHIHRQLDTIDRHIQEQYKTISDNATRLTQIEKLKGEN